MRGREWKKLSKTIIERDGRMCRKCGKLECDMELQHNLAVDHIIPARMFGERVDLMNQDGNLITLCASCHGRKTSKIEPRMFKGDMLALGEFYGEEIKLRAIGILNQIQPEEKNLTSK